MLEVLEDHLDADTQVDMFLSGGIDSSILAYLTKKKLNKELRHFSLKFSNKSFDESDNFLQVSNRLNLEPIVFEINKEEIPEIVDEAIKNMNSLILDPSYIPTYYLSKETSKYTKAVVSGDGADEIFGGYEWYRANKIKGLIPFTNSLIFSNIISFVLKNSKSNKYLGLSEKANIFFKHPHPNSLIQNIIWQSPLLNFYNSDIEFIQRILQEESERFVENPEQNLDLNFYLYTNILPKIDIAGMANGLEIRPPFLDERIVNFGNRLKTNTSLRKTKLF